MITKSKLDRLFELLEQGASSSIRGIAAEQIGHLAAQHPSQTEQIINRITEIVLYKKSWSSRVSAAYALGIIASQSPKKSKSVVLEPFPSSTELGHRKRKWKQDTASSFLRLEDLNMNDIVRKGGRLLGSSGEELASTNSEDAEQQFKRIHSILGDYHLSENIVSNEDFQGETEPVSSWKPKLNVFDKEGLINNDNSTQGTKEEAPIVMLEDSGSVPEWIFCQCFSKLRNNMFSLDWEVRHGAATGLRELLKYQATEACLDVFYSLEANRILLEDIACRLLILLAVDRFCDFSGTVTVAPVREAASMALATVALHLDIDRVEQIGLYINILAHSDSWEVVHAAYISMQYIFAALSSSSSIVISLLKYSFDDITRGLLSEDHDICAAAARCLFPVVDIIARDSTESSIPFEKLCDSLWQVISSCDEDNSGVCDCLELICRLYKCVLQRNMENANSWFSNHVYQVFPFMLHNNPFIREASRILVTEILENNKNLGNQPLFTIQQCRQWISILVALLFIEKDDCFVETILNKLGDVLHWYDETDLFSSNILSRILELCFQRSFKNSLDVISTLLREEDILTFSGFQEVVSEIADTERRYGDREGRFLRFQQNVCRMIAILFLERKEQSKILCETLKSYLHSSSVFSLTAACHIIRYWYPQAVDSSHREEVMKILFSKLEQFEQNSSDDVHFDEEAANSYQLFNDILSIEKHLSSGKKSKQKYSNTILDGSLIQLCEKGIQGCEQGDYFQVSCLLSEISGNYMPYLQELSARDTWKVNYLTSYKSRRTEFILQSQIVIVCSIILSQNIARQDENDNCVPREEEIKLPNKLTPYLLAMMNGLRYSSCIYLQQLSASTLAFTCQLLVKKDKMKAIAKIVENLFNYLIDALKIESEDWQCSQMDGVLLAWKEICRAFGCKLLVSLPKVNELCVQVLENLPDTLENTPTQVANALSFLKYTFKWWHSSLFKHCNDAVQKLTLFCGLQYHVTDFDILNVATDALSEMIFCFHDFLIHVVRHLLPILDSNHKMERSEESILYALRAVHKVVLKLGNEMIPYVSLFLMPLVSRMTHQNTEIRVIASETFGLLLRLLPLEDNTVKLAESEKWLDDPEWQLQRENAKSFIHQLLGWKAREPYNLPVQLEGNIQLREYQRQGLEWLAFLKRYGLHGLLCDDMGLGKTLMTLCIIVGDTVEWKNYGFQKHSLVIAPSSVTAHWFQEAKRFFGSSLSNVILYADSAKKRKKRLASFESSPLIITSYEIIRSDIESFQSYAWNYLVLDEGHVIRNHHSKTALAIKSLLAEHRLILSGTPVQNSVKDLWSLFDFLTPGFLGDEASFQERFVRPILRGKLLSSEQKDREQADVLLETLHRQVLPFILRRMKSDVLAELPPKIIQNLSFEMNSLQAKLYNAVSGFLATTAKEQLVHDKSPSLHIFSALRCLQQICTHPVLLLDSGKDWIENVSGKLAIDVNSCYHWKSSSKFQCLYDLFADLGLILHEEEVAQKELKEEPEETDWDMNEQDTGHRVLLFAQNRRTLDIVEKFLFMEGPFRHLSYLRLEGTVSPMHRQAIVTRFNSDPSISCMLLTTQIGGLGLNLTGADTVVFIEQDWNPVKDMQAMDRAHRIGQTRTVNVFKLVTKGTLEEKIMKLQEMKTAVAESIVNRDNSSLQDLDTSQLLELFQFDSSGQQDAMEAKNDMESYHSYLKTGSTLESVLKTLPDLWEEEQYTSEFNWNMFVQSFQSGQKDTND
ncbi:Probable helicase mot1 [Galdieria sulphuraria]|nr:Probable helicase mot1 [Galdieria sulphuraria]